MKQLFLRFGIDRALRLVAYGSSLLLVLLLVVGAIWATRLPPAPVVLPDPQVLAPILIRLPDQDLTAEPHVEVNTTAGEDVGGIAATEIGVTDSGGFEQATEVNIISRPLFWAERRPVTDDQQLVAADPEAPRKDELDQVKLVGVYFAGDSSGVIYEYKGERLRLRLKDELFGWELNMLSYDSAVFTQGDDGQKTLQLEHANVGKYTAPAKSAPNTISTTKSNESAR